MQFIQIGRILLATILGYPLPSQSYCRLSCYRCMHLSLNWIDSEMVMCWLYFLCLFVRSGSLFSCTCSHNAWIKSIMKTREKLHISNTIWIQTFQFHLNIATVLLYAAPTINWIVFVNFRFFINILVKLFFHWKSFYLHFICRENIVNNKLRSLLFSNQGLSAQIVVQFYYWFLRRNYHKQTHRYINFSHFIGYVCIKFIDCMFVLFLSFVFEWFNP